MADTKPGPAPGTIPGSKPGGPGGMPGRPKGPNLWALLKPYRPLVTLLAVLTIVGNALNLAVPKIVARAIDAYTAGDRKSVV